MRDLKDKVAVVTGAGSGIGRGTALALAEAGMHVVVADIDEASAKAVAGEVEALGVRAIGVRTDVADAASVRELSDAAWSEFGAVHVLHNNAGVAIFLPLAAMSDEDWRWTVSINLGGVVNGVQAFLPRMKEQAGEKHIVNTASIAGMVAERGLGAYNATKFAVVALSETLRDEVAGDGIGVSVLCPGLVTTNLVATTMARRPAGGAEMELSFFNEIGEMDQALMKMMSPEEVGRIVRAGIENNEPYIFTHPEWVGLVRERFDRILAAFDRAASA